MEVRNDYGGFKREFKVSASEIDTKFDERLKEIAPTVQLPMNQAKCPGAGEKEIWSVSFG